MLLILIEALLFCQDFNKDIKQENIPLAYLRFEGRTTSCPKYNSVIDIEYLDIENPVKDVSSTNWSVISSFDDDLDRESILKMIETNISYWRSKPSSFSIEIAKDSFSRDKMLESFEKLYTIFLSTMSYSEIFKKLTSDFKIYRAVSDGTKDVTITAYYEAEIEVSKQRDDKRRYAMHLRPPDLVKVTGQDFDYGRYDENGNLVKYYSTQQIREGAIDKYNVEFVYSAHPSHIMLAQIQGSAIVRYPDGDYDRIGFDGANGWRFVSVQKILTDCGEIPPMNFRDFINYLSSQPQDREERLVNLNPRYIFFKVKDKTEGAIGAISRPLIPHRSIAIDPAYIPYGVLAYIISTKPVADDNGQNIVEFKRFSRLVSSHDTGSAIRGAGRIDIFWGSGKKAELEASSMKSKGEFYIFAPKPTSP
ncbi:MAG: MltA domain-containing protein [Elusimicrobiales bacterium]